MSHLYRYRAIFVFLIALPLTGCLFRSRKVERQVSTAPLKSATQEELIDWINSQASRIKTLQATVDIDTSVGGAQRGKITDYKRFAATFWCENPPCCAGSG